MKRVACRHWSDIGNPGKGKCALGLFGGEPARISCVMHCNRREPAPGAVAQAITVASRLLHGAGSIAKTTVGIDRATPEQVQARLNVCRKCPGGHATWKDGDVHTCGPMIESLKGAGKGTCGCLLRKKALDTAEHCPFGWWHSDVANNAPPGDQK